MKPKANSLKIINKNDTPLVRLIRKQLEKTQINNSRDERCNISNLSSVFFVDKNKTIIIPLLKE